MRIRNIYSAPERVAMISKLQELLVQQKCLFESKQSMEEEILLYEISVLILKITYAFFSTACHFESIHNDGLEDIVQDSACTIYNKFKNHEYDPEQSEFKKEALIRFIKGIIKGHYLNYNKLRKIHDEKIQHIEDWLQDGETDVSQIDKLSTYESLEEDILFEDGLSRLNKTLLQMAKNNKEKEFIDLLFVQKFLGNELSKKEIAVIIGCSAAFVTKKEKQLLDKFKTQLNKEDFF